MKNIAYFILETVKHSRTTQQIAVIIAYLLTVVSSCCLVATRYWCLQPLYPAKIFTLKSQGHEAMVNWILPSQSRVQTAKNDQKIDRRLCWLRILRHFLTFKNGGKTERTWHLMWKTAVTYVTEGQASADNSVLLLLSFNSFVTKMPRTDT